ncbi:MAG: hypothetical protein QOE90_3704 [Thermoplasmata archaeon]|jgi:hypothetical protein|nr:hypothetical protein [Thermoplasmata archaeon]
MIAVRAHAALGLALAALAAASALAGWPMPDAHVALSLAAVTLVAQALLFWYLPSFAKRELMTLPVAQFACPWLVAAAGVVGAFGIGPPAAALAALGLGATGAVVLASALRGKPWRGGVPFWRAPGDRRGSDAAAALALLSGLVGLVLAALLFVAFPFHSPPPTLAWIAALAMLSFGALAHWLPRLRGVPLAIQPFRLGVLAFDVGALLAVAAFLAPPVVGLAAAFLLGAGLALALGALARPAGKERGPRARDAAPFLLAGAPLALVAALLVVAGFPASAPLVGAAAEVGLAALACAWAALALLGLPVVLNNVPETRATWPAALGLALAGLLAGASQLVPVPEWAAGACAALGVIALGVALAPLRTPRRDCPPQDS